jgi:hypothetical protein
MGGFDVQPAQPGAEATTYYKNAPGLNFGGTCAAEGCPAKGQSISHAVGDRAKGNPYALAEDDPKPKCLGCQGVFRPSLMWFYNCNVTLTPFDGAPERVTPRGSNMHSCTLDWTDYQGRYQEVEVTPS